MRFRVLLGAALLAGCTVGPHYVQPQIPTPPTFAEADPARRGAGDAARWWLGLNDPVLTGLIERGLAQNLDLAAAASRVREARLMVRQQRSGLFPTVNAIAGAQRTRISKNGGFGQIAKAFGSGGGTDSGGTGGGGAPAIGAPGSTINTYLVGFDASWQIDLFGGVRRNLQSATRRAEAEEWNRADRAVSIAAEIADDYYQLRILQQREAIARAELTRERRTLSILQARARHGLIPATDATRQLVQISTAEATLGPLEVDGRGIVHALGILVGGTPETLLGAFQLGTAAPPPSLPDFAAVPAGLPSDLLRRRPDVRRAERDLAAATSDIGVAVADLYPRFTITAPLQLLSTGLSDLFQGNSVQATVGGSVNFPLLDFGKRRAVIGQRREAEEQAYIAYKQSVLSALKETEDALARLRIERVRAVTLARGVTAARATIDAVEAQYRFGTTDLTTVLNAQADLFQAQDNLTQSQGTIRRQTVALYKALGGGWEALPPIAGPIAREGLAQVQPTNARSTR